MEVWNKVEILNSPTHSFLKYEILYLRDVNCCKLSWMQYDICRLQHDICKLNNAIPAGSLPNLDQKRHILWFHWT